MMEWVYEHVTTYCEVAQKAAEDGEFPPRLKFMSNNTYFSRINHGTRAKGRKEQKPELVNTCFGYNGKLTLILRVFQRTRT